MVASFAAFPQVLLMKICKDTSDSTEGRRKTDHAVVCCLTGIVSQYLKMYGSHFLRYIVILNEYVGIV